MSSDRRLRIRYMAECSIEGWPGQYEDRLIIHVSNFVLQHRNHHFGIEDR